MNIARAIIIAFIVVGLSVATLMLVGLVFKEREGAVTGKELPLTYTIPMRTIPTLQEIKDSIDQAQEKRSIGEEVLAEIKHERSKRRAKLEEWRQEGVMVEANRIKGRVDKDGVVTLPERKVVFSTEEEREKGRSRGLLAY